MVMDFKAHMLRSMAFSHATFGPGKRTAGVLDHMRKEIAEVESSNGSPYEWVDLLILAIDGITREMAFDEKDQRLLNPRIVAHEVCRLLEDKQSRNEARTWPDWRSVPRDKAIEHDRSKDSD